MSMWAPLPVRSRRLSEARIATVLYMPVNRSATAMPAFCGSPSGSPVIDIMPPMAWAMKS